VYGEEYSSRESLAVCKVKTHGNVYREMSARYMWQKHKMQHYRRQKRLCFPLLLHTGPLIDLGARHRYIPRQTFFTDTILTQPPPFRQTLLTTSLEVVQAIVYDRFLQAGI